MNIENFERLGKLLSDYNIIIKNEMVSDQLICVQCKMVLKEACQVPCGCKICRICVDVMTQNGYEFCPGPTEECRESLLSLSVIDYSTNNKVSKLVVKCPQNNCLHECELKDLDSHLRLCTGRSVTCPFSSFGCKSKPMSSIDIDKHFQVEQVNHSQILIEFINNINNEMTGLKQNLTLRNEVEMLKVNESLREAEIRLLTEQIENSKHDVELIHHEVKKIKDHQNDLSEFDGSYQNPVDISQLHDEINLNSSDNESMDKKFELMRKTIERDVQQYMVKLAATSKEQYQQLTNQWTKLFDLELVKIRQEMNNILLQMDSRMDTLERTLNRHINGYMVWMVDYVDRRSGMVHSDYFYGVKQCYKFQLRLCFDNNQLLIRVRLLIYSVLDNTSNLIWPFRGLVIVIVSDSCRPRLWKNISKHCQIDRPEDNSCKRSEDFEFNISDWTKTGVCHGLTVTCFVYSDEDEYANSK